MICPQCKSKVRAVAKDGGWKTYSCGSSEDSLGFSQSKECKQLSGNSVPSPFTFITGSIVENLK